MENLDATSIKRISLFEDFLQEWQNLLDDTADILGVPAGLITRVEGNQIEILLSSATKGNPYPAACRSQYPDSGWYCEYTLKTRGLNLIPNALLDPQWKDNSAAVDLHIISYLGFPIESPDGGQFGTVCFLDNKQNAYNDIHIRLVQQIKRMIELSLRVVSSKEAIDLRDRFLDDLSKVFPICCYCKKVRQESGMWVPVEKYVFDISGAVASHGVCPQCYDKAMSQID